jgi:hypothetical protein
MGPRWEFDQLSFGIVGGLAFGLIVGLVFGLIFGFLGGYLWMFVVAFGLALGLAGALANGLGFRFWVRLRVWLFSAATRLSIMGSPGSVLARDRSTLLVTMLGIVPAVVLGLGPVVVAVSGHGGTSKVELAAGLAFGLATGLTLAVLFGLYRTAWGWFAIARWWLALRRCLPWRLMRFLADAHEQRGVLRQVGAVYEFRHVELQHHLAGRLTDPDPPISRAD